MKRITGMYVSFKGVRNDEVGAMMTALPQRQIAALKGNKQSPQGRNGYLLSGGGAYSEIKIKQEFMIADSAKLQAVKGWLSGSGRLIFGDQPEYYYDAAILDAITLQGAGKHLDGQKCAALFTAQPFMHEVNEATLQFTSSGTFSGKGDVASAPLIQIEGSGAHTIMMNRGTLMVTLTQGVPLYVDCDAGIAYTENNGTLSHAGESVTVIGDWVELNPKGGGNTVNIDSGVKVTITPRWRYL